MQVTVASEPSHEVHVHGHEDPGFWRTYIFSTDHKIIGMLLMLAMRWQLAYPDRAIPVVGEFLHWVLGGEMVGRDSGNRVGLMLPDLYNSFGAMHGTIMVFLAIVPVAFAAFGNYVVPLQIGAPDMAFPRVNMASYQCYFLGGVVMFASFFVPGGAAKSGWTSYSPLATLADMGRHWDGQTFWLIGMVLLITSSLLGAVNFIATIIQLRAKGMTWLRLPFFVWAMFVTSFLLLLAFPPLEAAGIMQLMDNLFGTSFFLPTGLVVGGTPLARSGGGSPLLWQHLFWFLAHPEVYVLILPGIGMVAEIIAVNTRKPLWGYRSLVYSALAIGFLRLGASHVSDGDGHEDRHFLSDHHHDHLDSIGDHPDVLVHLALGRVDPVQHADALRAGISADVRDRGIDGTAAWIQLHGHPSARHVLCDWAFPLRGGAGDDFCDFCGDLSLVSEGHGAAHERTVGQGAFLVVVGVHERGVHADVRPGFGGDAPADV
jgi:hypothetical protein